MCIAQNIIICDTRKHTSSIHPTSLMRSIKLTGGGAPPGNIFSERKFSQRDFFQLGGAPCVLQRAVVVAAAGRQRQLGVHRGYIGGILGIYWGYTGDILGVY